MQHCIYQDSYFMFQSMTWHYQPRSEIKLSALSRQSNHSTGAGNKTEIKGLNVSIHEVDTDISEQKLINMQKNTERQSYADFNQTHFSGLGQKSRKCPDSIKEFY